jgi:hypothetical protein
MRPTVVAIVRGFRVWEFLGFKPAHANDPPIWYLGGRRGRRANVDKFFIAAPLSELLTRGHLEGSISVICAKLAAQEHTLR